MTPTPMRTCSSASQRERNQVRMHCWGLEPPLQGSPALDLVSRQEALSVPGLPSLPRGSAKHVKDAGCPPRGRPRHLTGLRNGRVAAPSPAPVRVLSLQETRGPRIIRTQRPSSSGGSPRESWVCGRSPGIPEWSPSAGLHLAGWGGALA